MFNKIRGYYWLVIALFTHPQRGVLWRKIITGRLK